MEFATPLPVHKRPFYTLFSGTWIYSAPTIPLSFWCIWILYFNIHTCSPSCVFPWGFPTNILHTFLICACVMPLNSSSFIWSAYWYLWPLPYSKYLHLCFTTCLSYVQIFFLELQKCQNEHDDATYRGGREAISDTLNYSVSVTMF